MKISEYIKQLQDMQNKYGDVEIKINKTYECSDLSINDKFFDPPELEYNKKRNCVLILSEFVFYS